MSTFLLALYIALIFIRPTDWWEPLLGWQLVNVTAIITLIVALPRILADGPSLWRQIPQTKTVIALLIGVTLSWSFWLTGMQNAFTDFGKIAILYLLMLVHTRDVRNFRVLLWTIFFCCAWMAIHGILQIQRGTGFAGQKPILRSIGDERTVNQIIAFGIFSDPNDLCLIFIFIIPLLWAEFRTHANLTTKVLSLGLIPLMAYGAWLTNSRGGILGIFGMLAAYAVARTKGIRRYLLASISILIVTLVLPARGAQMGSVEFGRINAWGNGIAAWKSQPLLGVGYGNYSSVNDNLVAHNSYVSTLTELGLVGYIPWFLLIFLTMVHLRRLLRYAPLIEHRDRFYLTGLFSGMTGYLTSIYFLSRSYNPVLFIILALTLGQTVSVSQKYKLYNNVIRPLKQDLKLGMLWCVGSIVFLWITIRVANAIGGR